MVGKLFLDGSDMYTTYGVVCERVDGALSMLKTKQNNIIQWNDEHGDDIYLNTPYYESRDITLRIAIVGTSASNYVTRVKNLFAALKGLHYLRIANINKGYLVYIREASDVIRMTKFNGSSVIGRCMLRLNEPHSINRAFQSSGSTVSFTISCTRMLTVWWGDGTVSNVIGSAQVASKNYGSSATRFQIIWGCTESITSLTPTGTTEQTD